MPVIDASTALSWIFERETAAERTRSIAVLDSLPDEPACVPPLWWAEVVNALLVGERRKLITTAQTADYAARLSRLPITIDVVPAAARKDAVLDLGRRHGLTAYDSTYLELAMRLGLGLATFDRALAKAATTVGVDVL